VRGERYLLHVQDLQPDASIRLGLIRSRTFIRILRMLESIGYRGAWRISGLSQAMLAALGQRGVPDKDLICFPNWAQPARAVRAGQFRELNRLEPDRFLVVYSGSLGLKQELHRLIEAMRYLENRPIQLVICGNGPAKAELVALAQARPNVLFQPLLPEDDYQEMLADANLWVVPLPWGSGDVFFPSKLLSGCAAGKPILAICDSDSELGQIVRTRRCGEIVPPCAPQDIARAINTLANDRVRLCAMGIAARELAQEYARDAILPEFWIGLKNACCPSSDGFRWEQDRPDRVGNRTVENERPIL
jgi:colanic acid biosynthesis glycosyl transferase WcaI